MLEKILGLFGKTRQGQQREDFVNLLSGSGIEVGALHRPVEANHLDVTYVDRMTNEELRKQYPELENEPLVPVGVIDDAESLSTVQDNSQDFVIANHVIEHMVNPIKSLLTWSRVLKKGGRLFLAVPDKRFTFDKERELTTIDHLVQDYEAPSQERDFEHFKEFSLYASCRTFNVRPESEYEAFAKELWDMDYSIHYHVWNCDSFGEFLNYLGKHFDQWNMKVIGQMPTMKEEFIYVLEKRS